MKNKKRYNIIQSLKNRLFFFVSNKKNKIFHSKSKERIEILDYDIQTKYYNDTKHTFKLNNKYKITIASTFIFFLGLISIGTGKSIISIGVKKILDGLNIYTQEQKTITIQSNDYNEPGSWNIEKKVKWTAKDEIEIQLNLTSILLEKNNNKDVLLVLDTSNSMEGEKLEELKEDTKILIEYLLTNENNKIGIVTFNTTATANSEFTQNINQLTNIIRNITSYGRTNYNEALLAVEQVLTQYQKEENKDLIVLFLTDGYPDIGNPNQITAYSVLKAKYPYIKIHGVQYEMGNKIAEEIEEITDKQWIANKTSLGNMLFAASEATKLYDYFKIEDVLDTNYFTIDSENDINATIGNVSLENNKQIKWDLGQNYLTTGSNATLTIKAHLKSQYVDQEAFYPTSEETIVQSKIENNVVSINKTDTTVLANRFTVTYDTNMPSGCTDINYQTEQYYIYDIVNKKTSTLTCRNYLFGGWQIVENGVDIINDDTFIMPQSNVTIRAEWKKAKINKTMEGTIHTKLTMYKKIENNYLNGATDINLYDGNGSDNYENNVYYYYGDTQNNNVYFGGYCWKIIRTTETGGVKLLYNGTKSLENGCNGTNSIIGTGYNSSGNSPGYIGYMYNNEASSKYSYKTIKHSETYELLKVLYTNAADDFYYSDTVSYNGTNYVLGGTVTHGEWKNIYANTTGKYVCRNGNTTCSEVYYIVDIDPCDTSSTGSNQYNQKLENGQVLSDVNKTIYISDTINTNGLVNPTAIAVNDWVTNFNQYIGKYTCNNIFNQNCVDKNYILSTTNHDFKYLNTGNDYIYGNSFNYSGGVYTLTTTKHFWNWKENYNTLQNHHYTCFNTTGTCNTLYYIIITSNSNSNYDAIYIELKDGKAINNALDEMLFAQNVNANDSSAKRTVDNWYRNNILNAGYSNDIEDTVYCNNRTISSVGNWGPNNSNTSWGLYFSTYNNRLSPADLSCPNEKDRFTVDSSIGNGDLTYPVGLITAPEAFLASNGNQSNSYLKSANTFFTMSPSTFYVNNQSAIAISNTGTYNTNGLLWYGFGIRPVVSLREDIEYISGNGSIINPFVIKINS